MSSSEDADLYEKDFIKKYIIKLAQKRVDELEKKLESTTDSFKKLEIKRKINIINQETADEVAEVENKALPLTTKADLGDKAVDIGVLDREKYFEYSAIKVPMNIYSYLFKYQKEGLCWMIDLYKIGKGGVLADEMGLGKTIQISSFIVSLVFSELASKFLILAPVTVIEQWIKQLTELDSNIKIHKKLSPKEEGIFIMSYESFRDIGIIPKFDCVFLDEGHKIKNKESQITMAVKRIVAPIKYVITGTPIQNNLGELWSIFDFVNPSLLGSYNTFQEEYENKIKKCRTELEKKSSYNNSVMLRSMIDPFIMRRMKYMIDHKLPNKIDKVIFVSCSEKQHNLYSRTLESNRFKNCAIKGFESNFSFLTAITFLRKICNHPLLITSSFDSFKLDKTELSDKDEKCHHDTYNLPYKTLVEDSSKLKITFELLDKWYSINKKALVFFQSVKMLQLAVSALASFRPEYNFLIMTGITPQKQRSTLISCFNNDKSIFLFLLTTRVGGLGINLTGASRVIIYDPDWNPSTDNQAKERIYRFGQKSEVEIYRLITRDTLEEKIYHKQIYKDCLSRKILSNPDTVFEKEYFFDLFSCPVYIDKDIKIENNKMVEVVDDQLVDINQEDVKSFSILKTYNSMAFLTGPDLIECIKRREANLNQ